MPAGGENIEGSLYHAESGRLRGRVADVDRGESVAAIMGRVCGQPAKPRAIRACRRDGGHGLRRALPRRRGVEARMAIRAAQGRDGKRVPDGRSGTLGHRRPTTCGGVADIGVKIVEAGPPAAAYVASASPLSLPREVLDGEVRRILALGVDLELNTKSLEHSRDDAERGAFRRGLPRGRRASPSGPTFRRRSRGASSTRCRFLRDMRVRSVRRSAVASWSTAQQYRARRRADGQRLGATKAIIVYCWTREKMPAHDFEVEEALQEACSSVALDECNMARRGHADRREDGADVTALSAADRLDTSRPTRWCCAVRMRDLSLLDGVRRPRRQGRHGQVSPSMMTGYAGIFAGGDMVPCGARGERWRQSRQEGGAHIDAWLARNRVQACAQARLASSTR